MKVGSLFAGIGGFDLGLERAGFEIAWQVEIDPYCQRVLAKHWPNVQRYGDIRAIDWATVPRVDLLCGGFPCQDLSFAGKRAGIDGERSGLWSEYVRAIRALRPRYILVENVPGLLTNQYMGRVLGDLAQSGYDAEWDCLPASAFSAPHRRDRVWITAYDAKRTRGGGSVEDEGSDLEGRGARWPLGTICGAVADASCAGRRSRGQSSSTRQEIAHRGAEMADAERMWKLQPQGSQCHEWRRPSDCSWWSIEPELGGTLDGLPRWLDRFTGGLSYAESRRSIEALRSLWNPNVSEALWRTVGGYGRVEQAAVLFAFVREYEKDADEARLLVACQKAFEKGMRSLRRETATQRASRQSGQSEQSAGEHSDVMQMVPQLSPCDSKTPWACESWEDGIVRVAHGIPNRVDRLRGLGNAIVPQIAEWLGRQIMSSETA